MMEFKEGALIVTSDFWYDLTSGGYIEPDKLLKNKEDVEAVKNAIRVIRDFESSADEQGVLESM
jgi:hypothetical protein